MVLLSARFNEADDDERPERLGELAGLLDTVDAAIAAGTIDGEELNAADFQIAPSVRLAMTIGDLRPAIESRPAGAHAMRVVPEFPGDVPPILPAEWLAPLRRAGATA